MTLLEPHPILTTIFGFPITAHGAFFALGSVVAAIYFARKVSNGQLTFVQGVEKAVLIIAAGLFGARFGYLLSYRGEWQSVTQLLAIWEGGLVSFWGMAAGLGTAYLLGNRHGGEYRKNWWNSVVLAGLLGWSIGRLGNYYGADSFGVLSSRFELFYGRVPIQLFESFWCLILFLLLRKHPKAAWFGVMGYFGGRFVIDFWRAESLIGPLHLSQWVSLLLFFVMMISYARYRSR